MTEPRERVVRLGLSLLAGHRCPAGGRLGAAVLGARGGVWRLRCADCGAAVRLGQEGGGDGLDLARLAAALVRGERGADGSG